MQAMPLSISLPPMNRGRASHYGPITGPATPKTSKYPRRRYTVPAFLDQTHGTLSRKWIEVLLEDQLTNQIRPDNKVELSQIEDYQKFLDRTHKRFINACNSLTQVRKLMGVESNKHKGKASSRAPMETGNDE